MTSFLKKIEFSYLSKCNLDITPLDNFITKLLENKSFLKGVLIGDHAHSRK